MMTRRTLLKSLGVCVALPLLESALPRGVAVAQAVPSKKRFIGCFFGSGAPMPAGASGDWGFSGLQGGALKPIADRGVQQFVSVMRGYRAVDNFDVHWSGTAAFLSSMPVGLKSPNAPTSDPNYQRCAKTFDQYIADQAPAGSALRSLHAGYSALAGWDQGHDSSGSINYVNSIAWRDEYSPISNTTDPQQMFTQVFGAGDNADPMIAYRLKRRQSVLDGVLDQYNSHRARLSSADAQRLDSYAQSIREIELNLAGGGNGCQSPEMDGTEEGYFRNFRSMQKIIIAAMQCDLIRSATIMYNDGIGENTPIANPPAGQHGSAHGNWGNLIFINQAQVGLWSELIAGLKDAQILGETVSVLGSNMSDGGTHNPANIPLLVASENTNGEVMRLGQEINATPNITDLNQNRNLADLYVDLFKLYGIDRTSFGGERWASTGQASGILV